MNMFISTGLLAGGLVPACLFLYRFTLSNRCPSCGSTVDLDRVSRPALVKSLLFFLPTKGFICYRCRRKFIKVGN